MKHLSSVVVAAFLFALPLSADFGFGLGPFYLNIKSDSIGFYSDQIRGPVCFAIANHKKVELVIQRTDVVSPKERKIITKKIIFDPYTLGFSKEGKMLLHGNVVEEKLIKEITIKHEEDIFTKEKVKPEKRNKGFFSGIFRAKNKNIELNKISNVKVIEDSRVDVPQKIDNEDIVKIICQIQPKEKK